MVQTDYIDVLEWSYLANSTLDAVEILVSHFCQSLPTGMEVALAEDANSHVEGLICIVDDQ